MLFNSYTFLALLLISFALYYIPLFRKTQIQILILASLVFYAYSQIWLVLLLLGSAGINILTSYYVVYGKKKHRRRIALSGVFANICILVFFKYSPLISIAFFNPADSIGLFLIHIPLPIGISFFTFEGISLLMDVWKEKYANREAIVPRSLAKHASRTLFFISFFPHLIAGPILKAHDFYPQMKEKFFDTIKWEEAFKNLATGFFLKMVVADNLQDFTYWIEFPFFENLSTLTLVVILFGYDFQQNFNFPYIASSFKDFWKRWHISLSSFLMEYLYFSLGGNRKGAWRTYVNLIITMTLGGLWHGAAWSYAVWGFSHGVLLAAERLLTNNILVKCPPIISFLHGLLVFCSVSFLWLMFKLPNFQHVVWFVEACGNNFYRYNNPGLISYVLLYASPVILYHFAYLLKRTKHYRLLDRYSYALYAIMFFLIVTNSGTVGSFIYFQF